jgi:hypothetical protein
MDVRCFDPNLKAKYQPPTSHIGVGYLCEKIGEDILGVVERFDFIIKPEKTIQGQPFDRLCRRSGKWYIVEIKGAQNGFAGTPSHTQKRRMRQVLEEVKDLEPVLLQIDLDGAKYKIRYGDQVHELIADSESKRLQVNNIISWVKDMIASQK